MKRGKSCANLTCGDKVKRSVSEARVSTPIGEMVIRLCSRGLHTIYQLDGITDENFNPDQRTTVNLLYNSTDLTNDNEMKSHLDECLNWLRTYFGTVQDVSKLAHPVLCSILDNSFSARVSTSLVRSVPAGKTITYGELASLAGSPGAQQAVGSAMARNQYQLIVPCHRVVKRGGMVGKYSGGCRNLVKVWLLQHEGFYVNEDGILSSV